MAKKYTPEQITAALGELNGWVKVDNRDAIHKRFTFTNFSEAFAFMARAALMAEKIDHHPEWFNVYKTVDVTLATHDADGVTDLDIKLAKALDRFAGS